MKTASAKKKGSRFELFIAKEITMEGLGKAGREANSGAGFRKGDVASSLEWLIECKNQKKLPWWKSIDQAKEQADMGNKHPEKWILMVRDPRTPETNSDYYAVVDGRQFLKLLKKNSEPRIKAPDRDLKWKLQRLKTYAQEVIREL